MRGIGESARTAGGKRIVSAVAIAACALLAAPAAAGADITVNDDAAGDGPAGANCAAPDHATISAALAAASASGDRVLVCAGTYAETQILIQKSVELIGAGPGQSIIDGGGVTGLPSAGLIRTNDLTNGDVLVQGFTIQNPGQNGVSPTASRMAIVAKGNDLGTTQEFAELEIIGRGPGGRDYALDADNADPDVILRDSTLTNQDFNPILIERSDGAVTIRDNEIVKNPATASAASVFVMVHLADGTTNPVRITGNDIDAGGRSGISVQSSCCALAPATMNGIEVRRNTVGNFGTTGISVANTDTGASGLAGEIVNVDIAQNTLESSMSGGGTGIRIRGRVRNVGIRSNTVTDLDTGILVENEPQAGHSPTGVTVRFNRIAGNLSAGLTSAATEPVDAEWNWWGCNEGPEAPACDAVTGDAIVDYDPWLVMGLTATPETIDARGDTATLTADLTRDSDGSVAGPGFPEATPIGFSTTLGTVQSPIPTGGGVAISTLASGSEGGTADVTASLDNAEVPAQVNINPPPPDPREAEPDPAKLRLAVTPKQRRLRDGGRLAYTATVTNVGDSDAQGVVLCARVPKKLILESAPCADIGALDRGESASARFEVVVPSVPKRTFRVRFTTKGAGIDGAKARAKLKIRP